MECAACEVADWLEFAGDVADPVDRRGLERTYLQAKLGATGVGDNESASAFFLREVRYRRRAYAAHVRDRDHSLAHRLRAGIRWAGGVAFDLIAGYGERPRRVLAVSLVVLLAAAMSYPATGGLDTGAGIVSYATDGPAAVVDGLYFSAVTFATLGLGDVYPVDDIGRSLAAFEGLAGAFLTALLVFSLGRRVTR
jgi:hypothetical protein